MNQLKCLERRQLKISQDYFVTSQLKCTRVASADVSTGQCDQSHIVFKGSCGWSIVHIEMHTVS